MTITNNMFEKNEYALIMRNFWFQVLRRTKKLNNVPIGKQVNFESVEFIEHCIDSKINPGWLEMHISQTWERHVHEILYMLKQNKVKMWEEQMLADLRSNKPVYVNFKI